MVQVRCMAEINAKIARKEIKVEIRERAQVLERFEAVERAERGVETPASVVTSQKRPATGSGAVAPKRERGLTEAMMIPMQSI